jgi:ABC-2 type transport system permease protein
MSTLTSPSKRSAPTAGLGGRASGLGASPTVGTGALLKFGLRRERIPLAAWIYGVLAIVASTLFAFAGLYPDAASRAQFADSLAGQPAFAVLTGKIFSSSLGGLTAWRTTLLGGVLAALMGIFTVIRRTRTDEEAGRTELLLSTVVGRAAPLLAGLGTALSGCVGIFVLVAGLMIVHGEDVTGSLALGLTLACTGLLFAGIAAVAAQMFDGARPALGISGLVLGVSFAIRAIADAGGDGTAWVRWLAPLGWAENVEAFAANNFAVIALMLLTTCVLVAVALVLLGRRDVGLGLFPARLGVARGRIGSAAGLATRLQLPSAIGWTVALAAFGAVTGSIVDSARDLFSDSPQMTRILHEIGGPGAITDAILTGLGGMAGILAAIAAITATGRMVGEEQAERAALVLATPVTRTRWLASHALFTLAVPAVALAATGIAAGILHGARSGDFADGFGTALATMLAQLPACWVIGGIAVLVFGLAPRLWMTSWIVFVIIVLIGQLGPALHLPRWVLDLSPFTHVGMVASDGIAWVATLILALIAVALLLVGFAGFRRRDLMSR